MNLQYLLKHNKQLVFIFCIAVVLLFITFVLLFNLQGVPSQQQAPAKQPEQISVFLQTRINQTTKAEVETLPNIKSVRELEGGITEYALSSISESIDDVIITQNGKVIFEKQFTANPDLAHPVLSIYLETLGTPEEVFKGSRTFGENVEQYIYASKGITVIGRPFSDEVEEIQQYTPMTVADYINTWGKDIQEFEEHSHESV